MKRGVRTAHLPPNEAQGRWSDWHSGVTSLRKLLDWARTFPNQLFVRSWDRDSFTLGDIEQLCDSEKRNLPPRSTIFLFLDTVSRDHWNDFSPFMTRLPPIH